MKRAEEAMSSSSSPKSEAEQELIPSLPNDIAFNILARIPRSQHPTLSLVSKPIRSLLSSPKFFNARSSLHTQEPIFYLTSCDKTETWFALYRNPFNSPDPNLIVPFPIPPIPSSNYFHDAAFAVVGPNIYVIGGSKFGTIPSHSFFGSDSERSGIPSPEVWVLDCRFNRWGPGPAMLAGRSHAVANVVDGKIYVMGGSRSSIRAEVLDPDVGKWVELPCPFDIVIPNIINKWIHFAKGKWIHFACPSMSLHDVYGEAGAVMDDKVYINTEIDSETCHQLVFDTRNGVWERVVEKEKKIQLGPILLDGIFYRYDMCGKINGFDVKEKEFRVSDYMDVGWERANHDTRSILAYDAPAGKFILIWGDDIVKCDEIQVNWNVDGELLARICSTQEIASIPRKYAKQHCLTVVL